MEFCPRRAQRIADADCWGSGLRPQLPIRSPSLPQARPSALEGEALVAAVGLRVQRARVLWLSGPPPVLLPLPPLLTDRAGESCAALQGQPSRTCPHPTPVSKKTPASREAPRLTGTDWLAQPLLAVRDRTCTLSQGGPSTQLLRRTPRFRLSPAFFLVLLYRLCGAFLFCTPAEAV